METTPRINEILVWFWTFAGNFYDVTSAVKLFRVRARPIACYRANRCVATVCIAFMRCKISTHACVDMLQLLVEIHWFIASPILKFWIRQRWNLGLHTFTPRIFDYDLWGHQRTGQTL